MTDYASLIRDAKALIEDSPSQITTLSNLSALLNERLGFINWVGFYLYEGGRLILGPFQGRVACTVIAIGKGVCGTAAQRKETVVVPNVHEFEGHIACDSASNSEIVIPVLKNGELFGVLDIDSPVFDRFTEEDRIGLEGLVRATEKIL
jgi:GAF domain-containing protein